MRLILTLLLLILGFLVQHIIPVVIPFKNLKHFLQ